MTKLYKVTFGTRNKKNIEYLDYDSVTVLAEDANSVLAGQCGDYLLKEEKKLKSEKLTLFVESIELISAVDFIN